MLENCPSFQVLCSPPSPLNPLLTSLLGGVKGENILVLGIRILCQLKTYRTVDFQCEQAIGGLNLWKEERRMKNEE